MAGEDLWAAEIALVGDGIQIFAVEGILGWDRHRAELVTVEALVRDLVRDDDVGSGIDSGLHIIASRPDLVAEPETRHNPEINGSEA